MSKRFDANAPVMDLVRAGPAARHWADQFALAWRSDPSLTATIFAERHPELAGNDAVLAYLAFEEYCVRAQSGQQVAASEFCERFPDYHEAVRSLISVHQLVEEQLAGEQPEFLSGFATSPPGHCPSPPPATTIAWPAIGERLGGFSLLEVLGQGAFARVYLAEEPALGGRLVVVKASFDDCNEAATLGKLSHPNIVPVHSVQVDPEYGLTLICMPFLGRVTLNDILRRLFAAGRPPTQGREIVEAVRAADDDRSGASTADPRLVRASYVDAVVHLGAQLAEALDYTNCNEICHRDLKLSNILIDSGGKPMLLDFNLSYDDRDASPSLGGTLPYMAPETIARLLKPSQKELVIDPRSDLFSLAVILWELLTGEHPFGLPPGGEATRKVAKKLYARQQQPLASLTERNRDVEPALAALIGRCLSFDPDGRPSTAYDLAKALRRLTTRASRLRRSMWRRRRAVALAVILVLPMLATGGYAVATLPPYADRQAAAGRQAYEQGDYRGALDHFSTAESAGLDPQQLADLRSNTYYQLAKRAFASADFPRTRDHCTKAIDLGLHTWQVYLLRGRARFHLHELTEAQKDFDQAHDIGHSAQIHAARGDCFCADFKWDLAIAAYYSTIEGEFASAGLFNNLAYALISSGHREQGIEWLDRAIAADKHLADAYHQRASICAATAAQEQRDVAPTAIDDVEMAIVLKPSNYRIRLSAARIYAWHARKTSAPADRLKALDHLLKALQFGLDPDEIPSGGALGEIGDLARASSAYQAAIEQGSHAARSDVPGLVDSLAGFELE